MKKTLLSISISGVMAFASAQTPTFDFESWTTMNNGSLAVPEEPTNWVTGNQLKNALYPTNDTSVFKVSGAEAHSGQYAMKITTVTIVNDPTGGQLPNPVGIAFSGKIQIIPSIKLVYGFPYTSRPANCNFWYKYTPQAGDSAYGSVALTKWNTSTSKSDTIAWGGAVIKNLTSNYTNASFTLTYFSSTLMPDTMVAAFSATCWATNTCGKVGSAMWVDDLAFTGWNGINEHPNSEGVVVYPNPANEFVNIAVDALDNANSVIAYDATGREVSSVVLSQLMNGMNRKSAKLNTSVLSCGIYSYSILDKNGVSLRNGKFSVTR